MEKSSYTVIKQAENYDIRRYLSVGGLPPRVMAVWPVSSGCDESEYSKELAKFKYQLTKDDVEYTSGVIWAEGDSEIKIVLKIDVAADISDENIPADAEIVTLAGGCFWCIEAPFDQMDGVYAAISGYAGGTEETAQYDKVARGLTEHREAVQVYFDPKQTNYEEVLNLFWRQIDPTDAGGQFADRGHHYTTAIFYRNEEQKQIAEKTRDAVPESGKFSAPIATKILPFTTFFKAEANHQNFAQKQAAYYQRYKAGSGRAGFIEENWGG